MTRYEANGLCHVFLNHFIFQLYKKYKEGVESLILETASAVETYFRQGELVDLHLVTVLGIIMGNISTYSSVYNCSHSNHHDEHFFIILRMMHPIFLLILSKHTINQSKMVDV